MGLGSFDVTTGRFFSAMLRYIGLNGSGLMRMTKLKHVVCRRSHSPIRGLARLAPTGTNAAARGGGGGGKIETRTRDFITATAAAIVVVVDVFASKLEHCEF